MLLVGLDPSAHTLSLWAGPGLGLGLEKYWEKEQ